jgi:hypothetical protein
MGKWIEQSSQKKYKWPINTWKMFNIFSHQENANQNYIEILPQSSQKGSHQANNNTW